MRMATNISTPKALSPTQKRFLTRYSLSIFIEAIPPVVERAGEVRVRGPRPGGAAPGRSTRRDRPHRGGRGPRRGRGRGPAFEPAPQGVRRSRLQPHEEDDEL